MSVCLLLLHNCTIKARQQIKGERLSPFNAKLHYFTFYIIKKPILKVNFMVSLTLKGPYRPNALSSLLSTVEVTHYQLLIYIYYNCPHNLNYTRGKM